MQHTPDTNVLHVQTTRDGVSLGIYEAGDMIRVEVSPGQAYALAGALMDGSRHLREVGFERDATVAMFLVTTAEDEHGCACSGVVIDSNAGIGRLLVSHDMAMEYGHVLMQAADRCLQTA